MPLTHKRFNYVENANQLVSTKGGIHEYLYEMVSVSGLTNQKANLEKSILKFVMGISSLKFEKCYIIMRKTVLSVTFNVFILHIMNDYAAIHCNAELRCYAVIIVDLR